MRLLVALAGAALLAVPASAEITTPDLEPKPPRAAPPAPLSEPQTRDMPEAELTATATVTEPQYVPPEPPPNPGGYDPESMPSIDEQIAECTRQTGLPQACEDKIRHGIP
ncbi:hypothetical protein CDO52_00675 [Nocardiopsis gilva YIM 90087]|uniref:Uncharacterized protein n=1 Tax=Nocardiopsis gilva YIM 90087 TaxID=1235441 RepID=A0A223S029_9ACTN|nr:hypothetical protein [Nocardiopsis gilva]ASU81493.1 hypothetical protein CDO52_00675 [Nocardiopsis gilva YIM 90087]